LRGKGLAAEAVEQALDDLERVGYIDDEDYARERLDGLLRKSKRGQMALVHALIKDGLDRDLAERIVAERLAGEDLGRWALEVAAERVERLRDVEPETARRRLYGYLKRRGFTDAQTLTAVDEAMASLHEQD
jgi:regulatory protein